MIVNDTADGYVIFVSQKELDRLIGWYRGWLDEHTPDQLDDDMQLKLMGKARGSNGYDESKYHDKHHNNNNRNVRKAKSVLHKVNAWLASHEDQEELEDKQQ